MESGEMQEMPIRADLKEFYGEKWEKEIRPRILRRAGLRKNAPARCEKCKKPGGVRVAVAEFPGEQHWCQEGGFMWKSTTGNWVDAPPPDVPLRWITCHLSIAHLDHTPGHDTDDNLAALCQYCHLEHDKQQHAGTRMDRKDRLRPVLAVAGPTAIVLVPSGAAGETPGRMIKGIPLSAIQRMRQ